MKKRAGDMPAPTARVCNWVPLRIGKVKKLFIGARRDERRVMEFMSAYRAAGPAERPVGEKSRFAITEMQLARSEARCVSEQADHTVPYPLRVLEAFAEHHVAAAFPVHRACHGKSPQPILEPLGIRQRTCVKLRIAAGQPAGIAVRRWRFVGKRREGND